MPTTPTQTVRSLLAEARITLWAVQISTRNAGRASDAVNLVRTTIGGRNGAPLHDHTLTKILDTVNTLPGWEDTVSYGDFIVVYWKPVQS